MINGDRPAYPTIDKFDDGTHGGAVVHGRDGLTKREMFAMAAMQGVLADGGSPEDVVSRAIAMADELLKQLKS